MLSLLNHGVSNICIVPLASLSCEEQEVGDAHISFYSVCWILLNFTASVSVVSENINANAFKGSV